MGDSCVLTGPEPFPEVCANIDGPKPAHTIPHDPNEGQGQVSPSQSYPFISNRFGISVDRLKRLASERPKAIPHSMTPTRPAHAPGSEHL